MRRQVLYAGLFFTTIDACMTFGFGMFTGGVMVFKPVMAFALGGASFVFGALLVPLAVVMWKQGRRVFPGILAAVLFVGFWLNLASNAGFTAAMFQTEIIAAANTNKIAADARQKIVRLRKRDKELTGQIEFKPTFGGDEWLAPASYDAIIVRAKNETERGRNIFARSKQCQDTTLATSQAVCQTIADATATKANAEARIAAIAERKQIRAELKEAEGYSKENQVAVSAAASQADFMSRFFTLSLKPGQEVKDWTTMLTALAISFMIAVLGWVLNGAAYLLPGTAGMRTEAAPTGPRYLASQYTSDAPVSHPSPLHAVDAPAARSERMEVYHSTTSTEQKESDMRERFERLRQGLAGVSAGQRDRLGMET